MEGRAAAVACSAVFIKLKSHYGASLHGSLVEQTHISGHAPRRDNAIAYFILLSTLAAASSEYGDAIHETLDAWNTEHSFPFFGRVGRIEFVQNGRLSVAYFTFPPVVVESHSSPVLSKTKMRLLASQPQMLNLDLGRVPYV